MHTHVSNAPGEVAILRGGLVQICEGNHCAAMLLDYFYERALLQKSAFDDRSFNSRNQSILVGLRRLQEMMSDLFTGGEITGALALLNGLGYFTPVSMKKVEDRPYIEGDEVVYDLLIHTDAVDYALIVLRGETPQPRIEQSIERPVIEESEIQPTRARYKGQKEAKRVAYHLKRAEALAMPATLILEQWTGTLEYFEWKCAYCEDGEYQVFEHYVPLFHGGGTTVYNCVPACASCNARKMDAHPSYFEAKFPQEAIERIKSYLNTARDWEVSNAS